MSFSFKKNLLIAVNAAINYRLPRKSFCKHINVLECVVLAIILSEVISIIIFCIIVLTRLYAVRAVVTICFAIRTIKVILWRPS